VPEYDCWKRAGSRRDARPFHKVGNPALTDILPPITETRAQRSVAAPPVRRRYRRTLTAIDVVAVGLVTYLGAAALNASDLQRLARRQPLGTRREIAVAFTDQARAISHAVGLDQPGRAIERLRDVPDPAATTVPPRRPIGTTAVSAAPLPTTSRSTSATTATPTTLAADQDFRLSPAAIDALIASLSPPPTTTTTAPTTTTTLAPTPIVSPNAPIAYWYGGDSLSQGLGRSLERVAVEDHGSTVSGKGVISTGLARPDVFDWSSTISLAVTQTKLNVAVILLGANDTQSLLRGESTFEFGTPEWIAEYRDRIGALMTQADHGSVHLIWVGLPPVRQGSLEKQLRLVDDLFRSEAARHRNTTYVDLRQAFGNAEGGYDPYCHDTGSSQVLCRSNDGVHFTDTGYDRLARLVMKTARSLTA
jgi:hypothetical protein